MTKEVRNPNDESSPLMGPFVPRLAVRPVADSAGFVLCASSFFRHSSFVIRISHLKPPSAAAPLRVVHSGSRREDFARAAGTKAVQATQSPEGFWKLAGDDIPGDHANIIEVDLNFISSNPPQSWRTVPTPLPSQQ